MHLFVAQLLSVVAMVWYLFMSLRFLLIGNDARHMNILPVSRAGWRLWDWTNDRFRALRSHPLYPMSVDVLVCCCGLCYCGFCS